MSRLFFLAWMATRIAPERVTTDDHDAYPRALRNIFAKQVTHRTNHGSVAKTTFHWISWWGTSTLHDFLEIVQVFVEI
jgi:hypothetical protein